MKTTVELLEMGLPTLLATFFNCRERDPRFFEVVSSYKKSIKSNEAIDLVGTAQRLTSKYGLKFEALNETVLIAEIQKSKELTLESFRKQIYSQILELLSRTEKGNLLNREIALALIGLRGSSDHKSYYAVDAQSGSSSHITDVLNLLVKFGTLGNQINYNPRAAQPGFIAGNEKDDQVRVRLNWVRENLREELGQLNPYKLSVLDASAP